MSIWRPRGHIWQRPRTKPLLRRRFLPPSLRRLAPFLKRSRRFRSCHNVVLRKGAILRRARTVVVRERGTGRLRRTRKATVRETKPREPLTPRRKPMRYRPWRQNPTSTGKIDRLRNLHNRRPSRPRKMSPPDGGCSGNWEGRRTPCVLKTRESTHM